MEIKEYKKLVNHNKLNRIRSKNKIHPNAGCNNTH